MAAPVAIARALPVIARFAKNPRVFKRFLGTKAGKKAMWKYGTMAVKSKTVQNGVAKFMSRAGNKMKGDKDYKKMEKEYALLQKKVAKLEAQLESAQVSQEKMQTLTFTLGRQVVEMQQLLTQMQAQYQKTVQAQQMQMAGVHTR